MGPRLSTTTTITTMAAHSVDDFPTKSETSFDLARIGVETGVVEIEHHPELESTNDRALQLGAESDTKPPLLVLADRQTAGRGRGSNRWWSAAGALTFSLLTSQPRVPATKRSQIALATGLAVATAVSRLAPGCDPALKWPNDIHIGRRKLGGILVEVPPRQSDRVVIGIGVNIDVSFAGAPIELADSAIALCEAAGSSVSPTDLLIGILRELEAEIESLESGRMNLAARWRERCLLAGRSVEIAAGNRTATGLCDGIDDDGALVLYTAAGPQRFIAGTVVRFD